MEFNTDTFEKLVDAIKESQSPTRELAEILKKKLNPVNSSKLYSSNFNRVTIGEHSYDVSLEETYSELFYVYKKYKINNEVNTSADCIILKKDMLYEDFGLKYTLQSAIMCNNYLLLQFSVYGNRVEIED